jgi:Glyoxalase-like domain
MSRGLDHMVHAIGDLDAAAELYGRLGFSVGARNRHPWGTHNRIIQLAGSYLELLTVAEPELIPPHQLGSFSFGAFNRDFLAARQGFSMLALQGAGAADADRFRAAGIGDFSVFDFERNAVRPDGTSAKLAFSLAFAVDRLAPDIGFFTCQHHHPENFWNPAFQRHPNTATGIAAVLLVADNPADHHAVLAAFASEDAVQVDVTGVTVRLARGAIEVMAPAAFASRFGVAPPDLARGARIAGLRFVVGDFAAAVTALKEGGIEAKLRMGRIVVGPETAIGTTLVFELVG